jgi:predicted ATPase
VVALYFAGGLHWLLRDPHFARHYTEEAVSLSGRQGFGLELARSTILRGWALIAEGNVETGVAETFAGLSAYDATGASMFESGAVAADACLIAGRTNQGLEIVSRALTLSLGSGDCFFAEPLHRRLKGDLLLKRDPSSASEAERCFRDSIAVAARQKAKSWELVATVSLARLLTKQGQRDEARAMLADIYNWFTEGFDTADLKDAKALLEELGA